VSSKKVDEVVLAVIRKQAEVILAAAELNELAPKSDVSQELSDFEKRLAKCGEQRQLLYERFILREIDRAEYLKLKDECSAEIERLNRQIAAVKAEAKAKTIEAFTLALAKRVVDETAPHKELVDALVDKVNVFPDKRIEIVWKIADFTKFTAMEDR
jgi:hypothetical protein